MCCACSIRKRRSLSPWAFTISSVEIEDHRNALVSDGVGTNLQTRGISSHHAVPHQRNRMHFVGEQAAIVGLVGKRLKEICRARAQGTVGIGFESADAEKRTAKRMTDADFHLIVNAGIRARHRCGRSVRRAAATRA